MQCNVKTVITPKQFLNIDPYLNIDVFTRSDLMCCQKSKHMCSYKPSTSSAAQGDAAHRVCVYMCQARTKR